MIVGAVAGFAALEGASSFVLFATDLLAYRAPTFDEPLHVRYDPDLGWVGRPHVDEPDMYGPGVRLRTNGQGFRNRNDVALDPPRDRLRLVCSGDSFTLGYGVDDDHPWCRRLEAMDARFETVNMGQGGYGADQAYLWYARDGAQFEPAVHVFALITADFHRMRSKRFAGHGKPVLAVRDGRLVTENVPVPQESPIFPFLHRRVGVATSMLRSSLLLKRIRERGLANAMPGDALDFDSTTWEVASRIFEALEKTSAARRATLVVVYLPTGDDYLNDEADPWRDRLRRASEEMGFGYIDLLQKFRELPQRRMTSMLIPKEARGTGHYNEAGHRWVAEEIHEELLALPAVRSKLEALPELPSTSG